VELEPERNASELTSAGEIISHIFASVVLICGTYLVDKLKDLLFDNNLPTFLVIILRIAEIVMIVGFVSHLLFVVGVLIVTSKHVIAALNLSVVWRGVVQIWRAIGLSSTYKETLQISTTAAAAGLNAAVLLSFISIILIAMSFIPMAIKLTLLIVGLVISGTGVWAAYKEGAFTGVIKSFSIAASFYLLMMAMGLFMVALAFGGIGEERLGWLQYIWRVLILRPT
jgi:hypothetical protein